MRFSEEFHRFIAPGAERLVALAGMLAARGLPYQVLRTGETRHLAVRSGEEAPRLILAAHYDRVQGSPGVLDNSCACCQLVDFAARLAAGRDVGALGAGRGSPPVLFVFTDAEESPGADGSGQGSYALARAIRACFTDAAAQGIAGRPGRGAGPPPVLVLDVTGRGDRFLMSSTPAEFLERRGLGDSPAYRAHAALADLVRRAAARAGLAAPISHNLPWSDDLGLVLGGLGALTLSLLPAGEADALAGGAQPATWALLHGPRDAPSAADAASFALVAALLDAVAEELLD